MATKTENKDTNEAANEQPQTEEDDSAKITRLENELNTARQEKADAEKTLMEAAENKDMAAMLKATDAVKAAEKKVSRAESAYNAATWELRKAEREQEGNQLHDEVVQFLRQIPDERLERLRALGISGFGVVITGEGPEVTVQYPRPAATSTRARKNGGNGGSSRGKWQFNGQEFSSAELLQTFGGEEGMLAVRRASKDPNDPESWVAKGYSNSPGFDAPVKRLARRMGWDGDTNNRVLQHEPTAE